MAEIIILHESDRVKALNGIRGAELGRHGLVVNVRQGTRTDAQNRMMWPMLQPFSSQVELGGRKWDRDAWKCIMMEGVGHKPRVLPKLNDDGIFAAGFRSSKLGVRPMTELLEFIIAEAAQRGIQYPWLTDDMIRGKAA